MARAHHLKDCLDAGRLAVRETAAPDRVGQFGRGRILNGVPGGKASSQRRERAAGIQVGRVL
jgi:hypothetical protein